MTKPLSLPPADHPLSFALAALIAQRDLFGDLDDAMAMDYVAAHPVTRFVRALHEHDAAALCWLCLFVAQRVVPCWQVSLPNDRRPRGDLGNQLRLEPGHSTALGPADLGRRGLALERLHRKGLVRRQKVSHAFRYTATLGREELAARRVIDAAGGMSALSKAGLLSAFVDLVAEVDDASLERLEQLVARKRRRSSGP